MMRRRLDAALLLARTTRNLRASQVLHRIRLRAQRFPPSRPVASSVISLLPVKGRPVAGWPADFTPLDLRLGDGYPSPEDNAHGQFTFLNDARDLGLPLRWDAPGASRLWKYHLHYMEWAWSFALHPDREWARRSFAELWRSWERLTRFGVGDPWSPYVASLRAWALCGVYTSLVAGSDLEDEIDRSLACHARFLRWHVEHDVGGNHLVKNLKALIGLGVFLDDERLLAVATRELERQLRAQVLADGGHYERSPSYHCQVLGDFIDIAGLLAAAGRPAVPGLADTIEAMRRWLGLMLLPDGDVPLFNDCVLVGSPRLSLLRPGPPATDRLTVLPTSGYVVMRPDDRLHLVADVGDPCPPELPAHAHADCLSFELTLDGERFVVDSGTSTYEAGTRRAHERSTAAHNTVCVDGADQTEVWGAFRAARLAHGRLDRADDDGHTVSVVASHDGYRRLPGQPVHRRTWRVAEGQVDITDEVSGEGEHHVESRLHFAVHPSGNPVWSGPRGMRVIEGPATYATGFGRLQHGHASTVAWRGSLPVSVRAELRVEASRLQGSSAMEHAEAVKGST